MAICKTEFRVKVCGYIFFREKDCAGLLDIWALCSHNNTRTIVAQTGIGKNYRKVKEKKNQLIELPCSSLEEKDDITPVIFSC